MYELQLPDLKLSRWTRFKIRRQHRKHHADLRGTLRDSANHLTGDVVQCFVCGAEFELTRQGYVVERRALEPVR